MRDEYQEVVRDGESVERLLFCELIDDAPGGLKLDFALEGDDESAVDDPDVVALVEQAIAALRAQHPELKRFDIVYAISR